MPRPLNVHLLPSLFEPASLSGGIAVVIDVLRASTTMTIALQNEAACVIPCGSIEDANAAYQSSPGNVLRGGERGGVKIDGFELSNSPDDYLPEVVVGRIIAFTTTNGTKALLRSAAADRILVGAFVNLSAILFELRNCSLPIHLVCAGTDGHITGEDVLFAGAVAQNLTECTSAGDIDEQKWTLCDSAVLAMCSCQQQSELPLPAALRRTHGGRNLLRLGYDGDIDTAAMIDVTNTVGVFDKAGGKIVSAGAE